MVLSAILIIFFSSFWHSVTFVGGTKGNIDEALAAYFGGPNLIPPLVNATYGGETEIMLRKGQSLTLTCRAKYPVSWTSQTHAGLDIKEDSNITNGYASYLGINNIQDSHNDVLLECTSQNSTTKLSTAVRVKVWQEMQSNDSVYVVGHSLVNITTTEDTDNVLFSLTLRRHASFKKDLKARWHRRFLSPVVGTTGGEDTKPVEYTGNLWSAKEPADNLFGNGLEILTWTPVSDDLMAELAFNPGIGTRVGTYTFNLTDNEDRVYFSMQFQLTVVRAIGVGEPQVYQIGDNASFDNDNFGALLDEHITDSLETVQINKSHILVCNLLGYPIDAGRAFIAVSKPDCPPMILEPHGVPSRVLYYPEYGSFNGMSSDSTPCSDLQGYCRNTLFPPRLGDGGLILSASITLFDTVQYGCYYNDSGLLRFNDATLTVTDLDEKEARKGIKALTLEPPQDEIIVGDNITLRCVAARPRYTQVFWKYGNKLIYHGDDPGGGYATTTTVKKHVKYFDLTIFNASVAQSGKYTCGAQRSGYSHMVEVYLDVNLTVPEPQQPYFGPETTKKAIFKETRGNSSIVLTCDAQGVPLPRITWTKQDCNDNACDNVKVLSVDQDKPSIPVPQYDTGYSGVYQCEIYSRLGNKTKQFRVIINEPPDRGRVAVITSLSVSVVVGILCVILAISYFRKIRLTRRLKNLCLKLQSQRKDENFQLLLNETLPTNDQTEALPFDFGYEVNPDKISVTKQLLGKGAFAEVNLGYIKLDDGRNLTVAVKLPADSMNVDQHESLLSEMKLMMHLGRHVNVLSLLGAVTKDLKHGILYAILEFCKFGSLLDHMRQVGKRRALKTRGSPTMVTAGYSMAIDDPLDDVSEMDMLSFSYQIASGMSFLSSKKVIHRDLALRNMLLADHYVVKIADFGLALRAKMFQETPESKQLLPLKWMAPESISRVTREFTKKSDVWSYGIVLWELYSYGDEPYPQFEKITAEFLFWLQAGYRMNIPENCPTSVATLINECWNGSPEARPSFDQCQEKLENVGQEASPVDWENNKKLLSRMANDYSIAEHYNLNSVISIKRNGVESAVDQNQNLEKF